MTMKEIWEMLSCYDEFVRVGISYIVNLEHLKSLNAQEMKIWQVQLFHRHIMLFDT